MSRPVQTRRGRDRETHTLAGWSSLSRHRLWLLRVLAVIGASLLVARLYSIAVTDHDEWLALAESQHRLSQALSAARGDILFRDGSATTPAAVNREYQMAYMVPRDIDDLGKTALLLSAALGLDESELRARVERRRDDPFEILKKRLSDEEVAKIRDLDLPGIHFLPESYRYYPAGELAAKTIGFTARNDGGGEVGVYGVEASWNGELGGRDGQISQERDAAGRWIPLTDREYVEPTDGDSLVLTIDRVIQHEVERILAEAREKHEADQVSAIVMEPATGKILAMATLPHFNPNVYGQVEDQSLFLNPTISLPYEPGSVMKPLTMAIGIEEGKISPESEYTDTGVVVEAGYAIRNAEDKVYGRSSMKKVLTESINTGVMHVERLVGNARFREYLERFGFGARTGVRLPAEHPGNLKNLANPKATIQFLTASFGQGVTATPLQLVSAYSVLANGGLLMQPQIVDRIIRADGTTVPIEPRSARQVVSQDTATAIGRMLRSVVVEGHGKRAGVPGYQVVGKTGTAQVAKRDGRGYEEGVTIGSFVGYAPLEQPRYTVLVKVDHPKDVQWAESSAAPTFGRIMQFLLSYGKVQPTETIPTK